MDAVFKTELAHVIVDTTVQEKNVTFPTDSKLYLRAILNLAKAAKNHGIKLRQTYVRVAKQEAIRVSRYAPAKQFRRMQKALKKLRTRLGRVLRDLRHQVPTLEVMLAHLLQLFERLHAQQSTDKHKL